MHAFVPPQQGHGSDAALELPLSTEDNEQRRQVGNDLMLLLRSSETVKGYPDHSTLPGAPAITLYISRLTLRGFTVTPEKPTTVMRLPRVLDREGITGDAAIPADGTLGLMQLTLATIADAVRFGEFVLRRLPADCRTAWTLTLALHQLGLHTRARASRLGRLIIPAMLPWEAQRLHEVARGRVDHTARALLHVDPRDVGRLADLLAGTLSALLHKDVKVIAMVYDGLDHMPEVLIKTGFELSQGNLLATALTAAHDSLPVGVER
ncbi:hypothetical protein [Streptomyces noursei]|uniref:hypothetical protein n=1 Tax=Streptomyces noursei TaxID=1971 RepID=UPI0023B7B605|nr:hypothetical protein [Streptomyces noursei]